MDCNDCHNRTGHDFQRAQDAVDRALANGLISRKLPYIMKRAVEVLTKDWTRDNVEDGIRASLQNAYAQNGGIDGGQAPLLEQAVKELTRIWRRNIYPDRKLYWDTYRDLKNHYGCMRCHDGKHTDRDGNVLTQKCDHCHVVLSQQEPDPDVLKNLGLDGKR